MEAKILSQRASVTALTALCARWVGTGLRVGGFLTRSFPKAESVAPVRYSGDHSTVFVIKTSSFYDTRFLTLLKFSLLLTGVPVLIGIAWVNLFIGGTELAEIPEGYIPEHWEYYKHPISRWIARTFYDSPEKNDEKAMAVFEIKVERADVRLKEQQVRRLRRARGDGPWYQYPAPDKGLIDHSDHSPKATPDN